MAVQTAFQQIGFVSFGYIPKWDPPESILKDLQFPTIALTYIPINTQGSLLHSITSVILTGLDWLSSVVYASFQEPTWQLQDFFWVKLIQVLCWFLPGLVFCYNLLVPLCSGHGLFPRYSYKCSSNSRLLPHSGSFHWADRRLSVWCKYLCCTSVACALSSISKNTLVQTQVQSFPHYILFRFTFYIPVLNYTVLSSRTGDKGLISFFT